MESKRHQAPLSRRALLARATMGVGTVALADLLSRERLLANPVKPELERHSFDLRPKAALIAPRAKAMISLFMQGGPSHMDLFDPKPLLNKLDGQDYTDEIHFDGKSEASTKILGSPWKFNRCGKSGMELSELLPHISGIVDEITLIRSMQTRVSDHAQSVNTLNTGRSFAGNPSLGSWITFGLGAESSQLPAFVALVDDALPLLGAKNWSSSPLPSLYQGTPVRPKEPRILNLDPPPEFKGAAQERWLRFVGDLNRDHLTRNSGDSDLEARIFNYDLAAKMQLAGKESLDISKESPATLEMYGINQPESRSFGERCLIARRLVERGVRFVQVFSPVQVWDHHHGIIAALPATCKRVDQPSAALVADLKQRGLLETTLVHWGGEMGRLPVIQNNTGREKVGRDHNGMGFSQWLAGGGVKGGYVHGRTDDFGHRAVEGIVTHHDYHATLLHLFGLDHRKLTYRFAGREQSLLDNKPCRIITELFA